MKGIEVISLVVDLLESLKLHNTLNVLNYEANLTNYSLETRDKLSSKYQIRGHPDDQPLMSVLASNFSPNEIHPPSRAGVLENNHGDLRYNATSGGKANGFDTRQTIEVINSSVQHQAPPSAFNSTEGKLTDPSLHVSGIGTSSKSKEAKDKQGLQSPDDLREYSHDNYNDFDDSFVTKTEKTPNLLVNEIINKAVNVTADKDSQSSHDRLKILTPADGGSASRATISSDAGSRNDVFRAVPGRAENSSRPCADADNSSDIDSDGHNDITVNSSHLDDYDYIEPVRRLA